MFPLTDSEIAWKSLNALSGKKTFLKCITNAILKWNEATDSPYYI